VLRELTLFGMTDKVAKAIARLRNFEPPDGFYLAMSGGKDAQCVFHLAQQAGVNFEAHYHNTTVDPPELIRFLKTQYPGVIIDQPPISMWRLIEKKKFLPTRRIRYCCSVFKEKHGLGRTLVTGVRWSESAGRKRKRAGLELNAYSKSPIMLNADNDQARRMFETCSLQGKHVLNPIIDWSEAEVWEYLNGLGVPHCSLYDEGWTRIGCIGCPMGGPRGMLREFARYPKYYDAYRRACDRMIIARLESGLDCRWKTGQEALDWWIHGRGNERGEELDGQMSLDDFP